MFDNTGYEISKDHADTAALLSLILKGLALIITLSSFTSTILSPSASISINESGTVTPCPGSAQPSPSVSFHNVLSDGKSSKISGNESPSLSFMELNIFASDT